MCVSVCKVSSVRENETKISKLVLPLLSHPSLSLLSQRLSNSWTTQDTAPKLDQYSAQWERWVWRCCCKSFNWKNWATLSSFYFIFYKKQKTWTKLGPCIDFAYSLYAMSFILGLKIFFSQLISTRKNVDNFFSKFLSKVGKNHDKKLQTDGIKRRLVHILSCRNFAMPKREKKNALALGRFQGAALGAASSSLGSHVKQRWAVLLQPEKTNCLNI